MPLHRHRNWVHLLAAACLWLAGGVALRAGDSGASFEPLASLVPADGLEVAVRLPLGGYFRSGCRLPMAVRIQSSRERRIRVALVPELWQVEQATAAQAGDAQTGTLDFQTLTGGSWSASMVCNAVSGAGAAGLVTPLMPVVDDIRRHLVIVEMESQIDRRGRVIFRGDLAPRLHELLPAERLVVQVITAPANGADGGGPAGLPQTNGWPPIPSTVRLPDGSGVTPRLVTVAADDLPSDVAGWGSFDLVLLPDATCGNAGQRYLIAGGQAVFVVAADARAVNCLNHWWGPRDQPTSEGIPHRYLLAEQLARFQLPPDAATRFPWLEQSVGFGRAAVTWLPPDIAQPNEPAVAASGPWRIRWSALLSSMLAARDPRLQPRKRVDQEAYASVFDPQMARLPQRLIAQVWWVWAVVVAGFAAIGVVALRRKRVAAVANATAASTEANAASTTGVRRWALMAGSCVAVAALASLYATRARVSAIEWRLRLVASDGAEVEQTYTYLVAWRSVGGLRLQPGDQKGRCDGVPLVAALRDFQVESGRLPAEALSTRDANAVARPGIDAVTLDSTRPLLLQQTAVLGAPSKNFGEFEHHGFEGQVATPYEWEIELTGMAEEAPLPRLPTEFVGWSIPPAVAPSSSDGNASPRSEKPEPLWLQGAQLNLPPSLRAQEGIYKPAMLKWLFTQIRQVTRGPVRIRFRRRGFADCRWRAGYGEPGAVVLDDAMFVEVRAVAAKRTNDE